MTKSYHHGDLRNALLEEAARVLEEAGPEGVSLRGLARTLDVSHAAPGHHFPDRRALLAEIAARGFCALADRLEQALEQARQARASGGEVLDLIYESGLAYVEVALEHPQRFKLMFGGGFLNAEDCPENLRAESSRAYRALLRISRGDELSQEELDQIDPETYEIQVPEFATWALVHGAATLQIDGALNLADDPKAFGQLLARLLEELSGRRPSTLWQSRFEAGAVHRD